MAITLDELLGRTTNEERIEKFPSFTEFENSRRTARTAYTEDSSDYSVSAQPRREEALREQELPRFAERSQQTRVYEPIETGRNRQYYSQADTYQGQRNYQDFDRQSYFAERSNEIDLHSFTANDYDRLSGEELDKKLSYTSRSNRTAAERQNTFNITTAPNYAAAEKFTAAKSKKKGRLSTKGKIAVIGYVSFFITIAVLIIVNAGDINKGKAVTPTSSVSISQEAEF